MCKLYGSGGFKNIVDYATGMVVSADGYILTMASPMLDSKGLRCHLWDGRRYPCKVVVIEPELDVALLKIDTKEKLDLKHWDLAAAVKQPLAKAGTGVLGFSNQFKIAERDEPMSVQHGVITAITKLQGKRGIHTATFRGKVYVVDAVTNNPGANGGALTTREGQLLGIIGKELQNELTNTWLNYALPIQTAEEIEEEITGKDGKKETVKRTISIAEIVEKKEKFAPVKRVRGEKKAENYTGLTLVPNVVEFTPPYVEEVTRDSPAAKAGLQPDDLIVYVDGEQVATIDDLHKIFERIRPMTPVKLEVRRGDRLQTVTLTMGKPLKPSKPTPPKKPVTPEK
jgi:serine protease Do